MSLLIGSKSRDGPSTILAWVSKKFTFKASKYISVKKNEKSTKNKSYLKSRIGKYEKNVIDTTLPKHNVSLAVFGERAAIRALGQPLLYTTRFFGVTLYKEWRCRLKNQKIISTV